jgi:hypothetical protein
MFHRFDIFALSLVFLASLAGCASDGIEVSTTYDPLTSFPAKASYAWDDRANKLPTDPRIVELDLGPLIKQAAEEEFAARGYRAVASGTHDYRLSYELVVHSWIGSERSRSVGTLSLLLIEADSGRRVWLGFGRAEVHVGLTRAERMQRMREALAKMLEKFPPAQRGS